MRKTILLKVGTALGVILLFVGVAFGIKSLPNMSNQNVLNVLNWTSYIPESVISDFENQYHIKVNYSTYSSNEELLAKVAAAPGVYDVIFPSDYMVSLMKSRDLLAPLDLTRFSNLSNLDPLFLAQPYDKTNTYSLPFLLATSVITYNSKETAPIFSYQDLTRSDLKNNLVLLDDSRIVIGLLLLASGFPMNDTDSEHLEKAVEFYQLLKPNIKAFDSDSPKTFFITDEVAAGVIWNAEATLSSEKNPDLITVYPEEGFALSMDNYTILKTAPHPEAAYLFIDYLMSSNVARQIVAEYPYLSSNLDAELLPKPELEQIFARGSYVSNLDGEQIKLLDRVWAQIKN